MAFRLSIPALQKAIKHLYRYGDTDVFPHLLELAFFHEEIEDIVDELTGLDLDSYNPGGAFEALAPKGRYSFRITHQLGAVDTVLLLAAVIEIGEQIDALLPLANENEAFSYRFDESSVDSVFLTGHTYKDWLQTQRARILHSPEVKQIVATDISDYYARINFHRLENLLNEAAPQHGAVRYIKKTIRVIRVRQSFGLPVGGAAARLLAELALSDTDRALKDHGIAFTRFVDDFRIFLENKDSPYSALSFLAQHLSITEGLALNAAKTSVFPRSKYLQRLDELTHDIETAAEDRALDSLTASIYFEDTPASEDLEKLKALNLLRYLETEISKESYDISRVKVIFRALRIVKPIESVGYITANFTKLVVFSKDLTLLMQELVYDKPGCFDNLADNVILAINEPPAASVQVIRTWLLELFVRDIVPITTSQLRKIKNLSSILDKRQLYIVQSRVENKHFFRLNKANVGQMSLLEQSTFICGAACLPTDEYKNWLLSLKPIITTPTYHRFLEWVRVNKDMLLLKLYSKTVA